MLPDMSPRSGTPTSGWQWIKVRFENPLDQTKNIVDWFGLNTGDKRMIIKNILAENIHLSLILEGILRILTQDLILNLLKLSR